MKKLSDGLVHLVVKEYGASAFLRKLSDPLWFQAFGCVLGFDWHSSGLTTVVTGVLKDVLTSDRHEMVVVGGKGKASRKVQPEIEEIGNLLGLSSMKIEDLKYASRMAAKVDTAAVQDGYPIYHHTFFITKAGEWCVVQQGLNINDGLARRYHWLSEKVESFVEEPHTGIAGWAGAPKVLNMTAKESRENRELCVDLVKDNTNNLITSIRRLASQDMPLETWITGATFSENYLAYSMPRRLDWRIFHQLYDRQPRDYEELLAFKGVGPSTVRALALVSELVHGTAASWQDPIKFSFAHGARMVYPSQSIEMLWMRPFEC